MACIIQLSSPVLFDSVILITSCRNNIINDWIHYFETPLIHTEVYHELIDSNTKNTINALIDSGRIQIVEEPAYEELDSSEQAIYDSCRSELKDRFDVRNNKDLGEYKTLIYSKLYNIPIISTQDTTVWSLFINSKNYKDSKFITFQDLSYMMYANGKKKAGRSIYKFVTDTNSYPRDEFFNYADSINNGTEFEPCFLGFKFNKDQI